MGEVPLYTIKSPPPEMVCTERELFIDNRLIGIHSIIVMTRWIGLASRDSEFSSPCSRTSTSLWSVQGYLAHTKQRPPHGTTIGP